MKINYVPHQLRNAIQRYCLAWCHSPLKGKTFLIHKPSQPANGSPQINIHRYIRTWLEDKSFIKSCKHDDCAIHKSTISEFVRGHIKSLHLHCCIFWWLYKVYSSCRCCMKRLLQMSHKKSIQYLT